MSTFKKWRSDTKCQFWVNLECFQKFTKQTNLTTQKLKNWVRWISQYYRKNGLMLYEMRVLTFDVASQVFILSRSELRSQATLNFLWVCGVSREVVISRKFFKAGILDFSFSLSHSEFLSWHKKRRLESYKYLANRWAITNKSFMKDVIAIWKLAKLVTFYHTRIEVLQIAQLLINTLTCMYCVSFSHERNFEWLSNNNANNKIAV